MCINQFMVLVKGFSEHIDEEIFVEINGIELDCFSYIPYGIKVGEKYKVEVDFNFFTADYIIKEIKEPSKQIKSIKKIGNTFSYIITGQIRDYKYIDFGIEIELDWLNDFAYLNSKFVEIEVSRIDLNFP